MTRLGIGGFHYAINNPGPLAAATDIVIPAGGTQGSATALRRQGAITHRLVFVAATLVSTEDGPLHAGEFMVPAHASLAQILNILRHGAPVEHQVTIPEGLTGWQIAGIINVAPMARGKIAPPPEGSVLPQTYDYVRGTPRAAILARAQRALAAMMNAKWAARDRDIPITSPAQALILASIVQSETPLSREMPEIAAVYENRLIKGMKLQADPTVIFAASQGRIAGGVAISRADLSRASPYNTYMIDGLPPGPICAPGVAAITAVLHPAKSRALYFVATGTGGHVFADDFTQQLKNIAAYHAVQNNETINRDATSLRN
ncbi:MAG: endolytic transglycosylase MltG [Acidocella sp.]|nr:endolytic transglycosylase MltG [Acidocella sp.]